MRVVMRRQKGAPERFDAGAESVKAKERDHHLKQMEQAHADLAQSVEFGRVHTGGVRQGAERWEKYGYKAARWAERWWKSEL